MIVVRLALAALIVALAAPPSHAFDRSDIPLKNWGGFSLYREAVYDDLERLVTAGLADRAVINSKPINRIAAARLVARAIDSIRRDSVGAYNGRRDLEAVLDRLMDEFRPELAALGVSLPGETAKVPGFVSFIPVDRAQARAGAASHNVSVPNSQGLRFEDGLNGGLTFDSRLQVGDFLTFYLQPEMLINDEFGAARLLTGYTKLTLSNVELLVGRESLWWGPGIHGSLILSNNARPLDQVRVGAAESFLLPLVGEWVGPTNMFFFVAQLEEQRDHPRAKLAGMRATATPFPFLELGISRVVMFNGEGGEQLNFFEALRVIFYPPAGDDRTEEGKFRSNNLFSIDADLRLANVERWGLPAKDMRVYGEFGWDDTCCESNFIPLKAALSFLVGVHLIGVFGDEGLEIRSEYAKTSTLTYSHDQFRSGYSTRGEVIGHHIGTDGEEFYTRMSRRFDRDLMIGMEINRAEVGATTSREGTKERTLAAAFDASYRFANVYSIFGQYRIAHVDNRHFRPHDDGWDHVLRVELTRSFR